MSDLDRWTEKGIEALIAYRQAEYVPSVTAEIREVLAAVLPDIRRDVAEEALLAAALEAERESFNGMASNADHLDYMAAWLREDAARIAREIGEAK